MFPTLCRWRYAVKTDAHCVTTGSVRHVKPNADTESSGSVAARLVLACARRHPSTGTGGAQMERIVCQWCQEENTPDRTECEHCGGPLHVKDRVGEPALSTPPHPAMPPPPQYLGAPAPSYGGPVPQRGWPSRNRGGRWAGTLFSIAVVAAVLVVGHIAESSHHARSSHSSSAPPQHWMCSRPPG